MKIGKYNLHIVNSGTFALDGGAMFGIIPRPLWQKTNPPDNLNRVRLAARLLLLQNGKRNILIDTGMGSKWDEKSKGIYDIEQQTGSLESSLANLHLTNNDITEVILTHLHFDHAGGAVKMKGGRLIPAFPNAKYYVQKKNFEWANAPSERDRGSYIKDNFIPLAEEGVLDFINGEEQFDDEIEFKIVNGHTFSQQLIKISDSSQTILYCCDLFPFSSHIPLPYIMGYDIQPLVTLEEKKKFLKLAADEEWKLFFEHDTEIAFATIEYGEKGYRIKEKFKEF